jgi:hypothetical protein
MITTLLARIRKLTVTEEKRLLVLCWRRGDPTVFVSRILKGLEFKYPSLDVNQQVINHHTISICYHSSYFGVVKYLIFVINDFVYFIACMYWMLKGSHKLPII